MPKSIKNTKQSLIRCQVYPKFHQIPRILSALNPNTYLLLPLSLALLHFYYVTFIHLHFFVLHQKLHDLLFSKDAPIRHEDDLFWPIPSLCRYLRKWDRGSFLIFHHNACKFHPRHLCSIRGQLMSFFCNKISMIQIQTIVVLALSPGGNYFYNSHVMRGLFSFLIKSFKHHRQPWSVCFMTGLIFKVFKARLPLVW